MIKKYSIGIASETNFLLSDVKMFPTLFDTEQEAEEHVQNIISGARFKGNRLFIVPVYLEDVIDKTKST